MTGHMPFDQARYQELEQLKERLEADAAKTGGLEKRKLKLQGRTDVLPIYRIPTEGLLFNKQNGRIHSEVLALEAEEGRKLDPTSDQDQETICSLLLGIRPDENEKISEDIRKVGQIDPGIVTCDGILINGNRRKAIIEKLYAETSEERYRFIEVQVLPSSVTRPEIWLIEAGIQMSMSTQLDYSPTNSLLKLREGIQSGITAADMAARIYGATEEGIRDDLERLDLIDEYLDVYLEKPGRYYLIAEKSEHFKNLQNIVKWLKRRLGRVTKDWESGPSDEAELKLVAFVYIRANFPHMRIRELRDLFCISSAWVELRESLNLTSPTDDDEPVGPTTDVEEEESEPEDFITESAVADRQAEAEWREQHKPSAHRNFERAKEQQQINRDASQPLALAKRALRNLKGIRPDSEGFDAPEIDEVLGQVIHTVNELRAGFQKTRTKNPKRKASKKKPSKKKPSKKTVSKKTVRKKKGRTERRTSR